MIAVTFTSHPPCAAPQTDKTALSLPVSSALYAHDTSSSFVIWLSPQPHLFLDSQQAVIYMQILVRERRRRNISSFWKTNSLTILQASLFSVWLDMAFRETQACCRQSWVGVDRDSERTLVADGEREQLTPQGWNFAGEEIQGKINPNCTYTQQVARECCMLFHSIPLYLNKRFNKIITGSL